MANIKKLMNLWEQGERFIAERLSQNWAKLLGHDKKT